MRLKFLTLCLLMLVTARTGSVMAHVLISDTNNEIGAVLHITPDDDPIAGEDATIYLDVDLDSIDQAKLIIRQNSETSDQLNMDLEGSLAYADYVFTGQASYRLTFEIVKNKEVFIFESSLRVSRGGLTSADRGSSYAWANMLLIFGSIGSVALAIVAFNNRSAIKLRSKF